MVAESWFRGLWKIPLKHDSGSQKVVIGVLAFEFASLMSKMVHMWQSLNDKQVAELREEIANSVGIKKLVSEDDDYIVRLICAEMIDNVVHVAKSLTRLGNRCSDHNLKGFEHAFDDMVNIGADPNRWVFSWKRMNKKVKKMEHFISLNASLYQEMEMLSDLEQTIRRMKCNDPQPDDLLDHQKKLIWKQQEVKNLRNMSLWNKTYDYTVRLLMRSLFTIYCRINQVFGMSPMVCPAQSKKLSFNSIYRSQSVSTLLQSSIHPSEKSSIPRFSSGKFAAMSGPDSKSSNATNFHSGPLGDLTTKSGAVSGNRRKLNFFSGPLGRPTTKSGPGSGTSKSNKKMWLIPQLLAILGKKSHLEQNRLTQVGPFKGCMVVSDSSIVANCYLDSTDVHPEVLNGTIESGSNDLPDSIPSILSSEQKFLNAVPETLGAAALALHYSNVIVVIEKLAVSPHLIDRDTRDDLYNMLPASVRTALRTRLKPYIKSLACSVYDSNLAQEWTEAVTSALEWLAPLAHNMIRWQSERSFEQNDFLARTNVLLVQTLYFANQEKTEATITELLVGLNYLWRSAQEVDAKALRDRANRRTFNHYLELDK